MQPAVRYHSCNLMLRLAIYLLVLCTSNSEMLAQDTGREQFKIKRALNIESFIILRTKVDCKASFLRYDIESATYGRKNPKALRYAGFDAARLAVEPVPLLDISEVERRKVYIIFDQALRDFLDAGLKIIFDLHMTGRDPIWDPGNITAVSQVENFQRHLEVIASVGRFLLVYDPQLVAFDLFNEPPCIMPWQWAQLQKEIYTTAREVLPNPTIISFSPDSGIIGDGITDADLLTLNGTAVAGSTVSIFDGTTLLGMATANASGVWSFATNTLLDDTHSFTATDTYAGNTSQASSALTVTVDTTPPAAPAIESLSGYSAITNGGMTADDVLTLGGTGEPNSTVTVLDGTKSLGTDTVNSNGTWDFTTGQLGEGSHSFSAIDTDVAGNVSPAASPFNVTVETLSGGAPASIGVNMDGAEYSWGSFPTLANLENVKSEGVNLVRLPIAWEMMQSTLDGPLNSTYLAGLKGFLSNAASLGIQVIVDLHNYGAYNLNWAQDAAANYGIMAPGASDASVIGSAAVPISAFANFWQQLATSLNGNPAVAGYDIMNEPHNLPTSGTWQAAAQAAVNAIRSVDMLTSIIVEGNNWSSAASWLTQNANLNIVDPVNNVIYSAHQYFDNGTGQYALSYAQQGATPNTGVQDVAPFLQWLQANNYRGFDGELGIPSNDPQWIPLLNNVLNTLQAHGVSATVWNYEAPQPTDPSWWDSYITSSSSDNLNIAPINGQINPVMALLFKHSAPVITSFSPNSGTVGNAITNASVLTLTGIGAGNSTVRIFDGATLLGTTTASINGAWNFTTAALTNGAHNFTATDMDSSGDISRASSALSVTVNTVAPSAPAIPSLSPGSGHGR
jgi:aryl-phospho-beta-D-glucosidase BglC (GH1 family)